MSRTIITCPLCPWHYEVPPMDPRAVDPVALASVFGHGVFAAHAINTQTQNTERALEEHFKSHMTVEWLTRVTSLASQLEKLRPALMFVKELSGECLDNGDVKVGTAAEVAMRHIWRRADETL